MFTLSFILGIYIDCILSDELLEFLFPNCFYNLFYIGFDSRYSLYHHRIVFFSHSLFYTRSQSYLFLRLHLFINSPIRKRYSRSQLNAFIYSAVCTCERAESWTARARVNGGGSVFTSHVMSTPPRHNLCIIYDVGAATFLWKRIFQEHGNSLRTWSLWVCDIFSNKET